ncbi:hypothetical protein L1049_012246 [Liquidambar formosana]|uniref:Uncharacterized protein n=1 Tax=Liquidambar formosana TaxID=63359 RepID=A0AAP0X367_LIQFO
MWSFIPVFFNSKGWPSVAGLAGLQILVTAHNMGGYLHPRECPRESDCDSDQILLRNLVPKAIIARAERLPKRNSKKTAKRKRKLLDDLPPWRKQCFNSKCTAKSKDKKLSRRRKRDFLSSSMIGDFSVSDDGIVNRNRLCIEEAKQTWDTMVRTGIDSLGNDSEILNTLAEMNRQDWDRFVSTLGP